MFNDRPLEKKIVQLDLKWQRPKISGLGIWKFVARPCHRIAKSLKNVRWVSWKLIHGSFRGPLTHKVKLKKDEKKRETTSVGIARHCQSQQSCKGRSFLNTETVSKRFPLVNLWQRKDLFKNHSEFRLPAPEKSETGNPRKCLACHAGGIPHPPAALRSANRQSATCIGLCRWHG